MKVLFFGLVATFFSTVAYAQLDTRHYIPPLHARIDDATGSGEDIYLLISTPQATPFDVTITDGAGTPLFAPVSVSRTSPASMTLSSAIGGSKGPGTKFLVTAAQLATVLSDEGLILTANKAFFANIRVDESAQAESITSKGTAGFGTEFRSGHIWNDGGGNDLKAHVISFMATEDNTTVTISDFGGVDFENVSEIGGSIVVNLSEGESYVLAAYADADVDNVNEVNGTRISSDKPIAVNSGSWLAGAPGGTSSARDIGVDQIAPIDETGFEYILIKGEGTTNENVIAVAGIDGTDLYVNGSLTPINPTPLSAGDYFRLTVTDYTANENMYIRSNQPVYIYQGLNGVADSNERQFGLNYVPPIVCLGGTNVDLPDIGQLGAPVIQVIAETGAQVTITQGMTSTDIPLAQAKTVTGRPEYVTYKIIDYTTGDVTVESPRPIRVALTFASGNVGAAGFFSGFTTAPVVESPNGYGASTCIPDNLPVTLTASGFDDFQWYRDGIELPGETSSSLAVTSPGLYTAAGKIAGCVPSVQAFPLTIALCPGDIGAAKNTATVNNVSGSIFDVVFDVVVTNYSATNTVPNMQLVDDLNAGLPAGATATLQTAPAIVSGSFISGGLSPSYNGVSDVAMLQTSSSTVDTELGISSSVTIRFTVRIDMSGATSPAYNSQAVVTTSLTSPNDGVTSTFDKQDFSDSGTNPDPDGDGDPTETGENDITMVCVDNTTISYDTDTYYTSGTDPTATITGLAGGTFSAGSGLSINNVTGEIDLSASFVGSYTVTYSFGGSCPTTTPVTIELNPPAEPTVISQQTNSTTPTISGSASLEVGEDLSVTVDNITYTLGDGNLSIAGTTWTLIIPPGNPITPDGTYDVTATITNGPLSTDDLTSAELTIDTDPPSLNIQGEPSIAEGGTAFTVTFEFDENVTGFGITDVVIANGTSSGFTGVDGNTYTLSVTPDGSGNVTVDVAATAKDAAGNDNIAAPQAVIPLEVEAIYAISPARNVDDYADNDVLASVTDANGAIASAALAAGSLPAGISLNATTGAVTVSDAALLSAGSSNFDVTTTDALGGVTTQTVSIVITSDNEAVYAVNTAQNIDSYADSDVLATVSDTDGAIASAVITTGSLPAGTALNAASGEITVSDASSLAAGTVNFDVTTTDEDGGITTQTVSIVITADNEAVYAVNTAQNIDSYADSDVLATVSDTDGAIASAVIASGSLPAGTALNTTSGEITVSDATSLAAGTVNFDVTTTDADGGITTQTVSIVITADNEAVYSVAAAENIDSYADTDVLATVSDTDGAIASAVVATGSLPAGTALNATSGEITVSDASSLVAGTANFDVTTTDEDGGITTQTVSIVITSDNEAVYAVNTAQNIDSYADSDVLATVSDTDGAIASAVIASGSLPAGTALNAVSGEITVSDASSLAAGTVNFDVTTTDADGGITTQTVSIIITADNEAVYAVNPAQNIDSYADSDVLATVSDADGAIASAAIASGSLPAGTALNATSGEITVSDATLLIGGSFSLDVTTTDVDGGVTTQTIAIDITADNEAVYSIVIAKNIDSYADSDVLATVTDTDGAIVTVVLATGTLPAGTALNATSGEITVSDVSVLVAGSFSYDVTTTDEDGGITTQTVTLDIIVDNEAAYAVAAAQNIDSYADSDVLATVGDADASITSATISSGSLPTGVTINATNGSITVSDASLLTTGTTTVDVTTIDAEGGETTQPLTIEFIADNEGLYATNPAHNVDSYAANDMLAFASDGDGAIVSAVISTGTLPAGTSLDANTGAIKVGNASLLVAGTTGLEIITTDETGGTTLHSITLTFTGDVEAAYLLNSSKNVDSYVNGDVLSTVTDGDGSVASALITDGALPAGTSLNNSNGMITISNAGIVAAGTYTFGIRTTDTGGGETAHTITLVFTADNESNYVINPPKNIDAYADHDIMASAADDDGDIQQADLTSGSLPPGVTLDPVTGALTIGDAGAVQEGTYDLQVTTTDETGGLTVHDITLKFGTDNEAIYTVATPMPLQGYTDATVLASVSDADGSIAEATVTGESLPLGIALDPVSGTLTVSDASLVEPGSYVLEISTRDNSGGTSIHEITIEILPSTLDSDEDGVLDVVEDLNHDKDTSNDDTDGDGTPNYLDTDDDGDGLLTLNEDQNTNGDPQDDDTDGDGLPDYLDPDDDNDGIPSVDEDGNDNGTLIDDDCDGDGTPNYLDHELCEVVPENGFSPNGDGNNDAWVIHGIDHYPGNSVKVFNRWGNLVFEADGYNNNSNSWSGEGNGKLRVGASRVPDGTYFYFINVDGEKRLSGYVILKR